MAGFQRNSAEPFVDLTLGASGSTYTAPANGWFYIAKISMGSDEWAGFSTVPQSIAQSTYSSVMYANAGKTANSLLPVIKDQNVYVYYTASSSTLGFRFIYAEGSEND